MDTDNAIADKIVHVLNVCDFSCESHAKCKCESNHKIESLKQVAILGVEVAAGKPVQFAKTRASINIAKVKAREAEVEAMASGAEGRDEVIASLTVRTRRVLDNLARERATALCVCMVVHPPCTACTP